MMPPITSASVNPPASATGPGTTSPIRTIVTFWPGSEPGRFACSDRAARRDSAASAVLNSAGEDLISVVWTTYVRFPACYG